MEDMPSSESQTRIRWTDELVGILDSNTSRKRKTAAAGLLGQFAHSARLEPLERLLLAPHDDPWIRRYLLRAFVERALPITTRTFEALTLEFAQGLDPWHDHHFPVASFFVLGKRAGHTCAVRALVDSMDAGSLRRLLCSHHGVRLDDEDRAVVYRRLVDKGGLDVSLAWETLEFEDSQELALQGPVCWGKLHSASDVFVQRCIKEHSTSLPKAIESLALPARWLLHIVPHEELAPFAEAALLDQDADLAASRTASTVLTAMDDAAARIDALLRRDEFTTLSGQNEFPMSKREALVGARLSVNKVNPGLEPSLRTLVGAFVHNEAPMAWVHWACAHSRPAFQCLGVEALFAREGSAGNDALYRKALASEVLTRTCALRMPASKGDEAAIQELKETAEQHASPVVRAEALLSLRASRPWSEFAELSLRMLTDQEIVGDYYAPVMTAAATALQKAEGLNADVVLRALVDAQLEPVSNDASDTVRDTIGTWFGDEGYSRGARWRRMYWEKTPRV